MKTVKNIHPQICSFENLLSAAKKAQKGKRFKNGTSRFNVNLEKELVALRKELASHAYQPGAYTSFFIFEPKKRMISAAPYRDRVVHHSLCNVIEPIFERTFIFDSYANRKGKGTHKAILRYQEFSKKCRYVLKCDIQKFFASMDHEILKKEIRRKIGDADTLSLIDAIIDGSNPQEQVRNYFMGDNLFTLIERRKGIPIGNLTSQFFANVYLNAFDHFVKEKLRCRYYLRYVDDFVLFGDDKALLHEWKSRISEFLDDYRLKLHENKTKVFPVTVGLTFLGHRIFPGHRRLKRVNVIRFRRRMRKLQRLYSKGTVKWVKIMESLQSWNAHASFSNTYRLRSGLYSEFVFQRRSA